MLQSVKLNSITTDYRLYPRHRNDLLDTSHMRNLKNAMLSGADIPPIVVERVGMICLDGHHRLGVFKDIFKDNPEQEIIVDLVDLQSDAAMFLEAVRLNAAHGKPLEPKDRAYIGIRAKDLGIPLEKICEAMNIRCDDYLDFYARRTAQTTTGKTVPLSWGASKLAGQVMTEKLEKFAGTINFTKPEQYAMQLLRALQVGYPFELKESFIDVLVKLRHEINKLIGE
jgi:hypothetical protein